MPLDTQFEDIFVPPGLAATLFHGDLVEVKFDRNGEVFDLEVVHHRFSELVGTFSKTAADLPRNTGTVTYENRHAREVILVPLQSKKPKEGDWVRIKLAFDQKGLYPVTGEIVEIYGSELPSHSDIGRIAGEYGLTEEHSAKAFLEARELSKKPLDTKFHKDLTHIPFVTIDPKTAKDFDDAVYVERSKKGYDLWVAIADVSEYVKPRSALDKEARHRSTTTYFPEKAFHMLPQDLSENLCSLRPNTKRSAMVAKTSFDQTGKPLGVTLFEGIIESRRRAIYEEVQSEIESPPKEWPLRDAFELYKVLRKKRNNRGSVDFDLPECQIEVDSKGQPTNLTQSERFDAHRLIEEFMIATNEAVTSWMTSQKRPMIYRNHDAPSESSLEKLHKLAKGLGVNFRPEAANIAKLARDIKGKKIEPIISMAMLRSMKLAVYEANLGIHFGLASKGYSHFTSPIRRYPDLVLHRLIKYYLRKPKGKPPHSKEELQEMAQHCNYRERLSAEAERDAIRLKQIRYMQQFLGDNFRGSVNGMNERGIFVQIKEPYVEGFLEKDELPSDRYNYDETTLTYRGRATGHVYKIGDPIEVQLLRTSLEERSIEFSLPR